MYERPVKVSVFKGDGARPWHVADEKPGQPGMTCLARAVFQFKTREQAVTVADDRARTFGMSMMLITDDDGNPTAH